MHTFGWLQEGEGQRNGDEGGYCQDEVGEELSLQ